MRRNQLAHLLGAAPETQPELMNGQRRIGHIDQLWKIKLQQYRRAEKEGRLEQFINDEVWRKW